MQAAWEGGLHFKDEVAVVPEAIGLALDDLDLVVDAFKDPGVDGVASMVDDAVGVIQQAEGEAFKG